MRAFGIVFGVVLALAGVACLVMPDRVLSLERRAPQQMQHYGARDLWRRHEHARIRLSALAFAVVSAGFFALAFGVH